MKRWLCLNMPWHKWIHSFWASDRAEVFHCARCGTEWVANHEVQAVIAWDDETKAFYRSLGCFR